MKNKLSQYKIWTLLCLLIASSCRFAEKERFIVSDCQVSNFIIIYNVNDGQSRIVSNGKTSYQIPENGIILTNYPREKGVLNQEFLKLSEEGKLIPIEDNSSCDYTGRLQTAFYLYNTDLYPDKDLEEKIWYKYYALVYSNDHPGGIEKDQSQYLDQIKSYLIENKIKSKDSVLSQNP